MWRESYDKPCQSTEKVLITTPLLPPTLKSKEKIFTSYFTGTVMISQGIVQFSCFELFTNSLDPGVKNRRVSDGFLHMPRLAALANRSGFPSLQPNIPSSFYTSGSTKVKYWAGDSCRAYQNLQML